MGKAEEAGGRRGAANVFANVSVAAFCVAIAALAPGSAAAWRLAAAAALATALMDTMGTEVGQAIRTPTVLLPDFRRVPPGTDGAVSVAGTAAGLAAAALFAAAAVGLSWIGPFPAAALVVARGGLRDGRREPSRAGGSAVARLERPRPELPEHARRARSWRCSSRLFAGSAA